LKPPRWKEITPSEFPWEREALEFVREGLPDHEPYRAWSNFTFIAGDGSLNEVDLLVVSPTGIFLVEIKSRPGKITGDAGAWTWEEDGRRRTYDNPRLLADRKAKRLSSLLSRQSAAKKVQLPFLAAAVFCSDVNQTLDLPPNARQNVWLRDRERTADDPGRRGIVWGLTNWPDDLPEATRRDRRIDKPVAKAFSRAMEQAGVQPSQRARRIGDYLRGDLLFEGPGYQDWTGKHTSVENLQRRIRIYSYATAAGQEEKQTIRRAAHREFQILEGISHRGILRASDILDIEHGAAILFERDPSAMRLDHFIQQYGEALTTEEKLDLLRQTAEALQFAHQRRVTHRALSPQSILVRDPTSDSREIQIFNWQAGARDPSAPGQTRQRLTATIHLEQLIEDASAVYVAPEALTDERATGEQLDVFSLGAIAYFLFTGEAPASDFADLQHKLQGGPGLQVSAVVDGAARAVQELVESSTAKLVDDRLESVEDFLVYLSRAEEELLTPAQEIAADPVEARAGDPLGGGLVVAQRLGRGSTAVAFLVERDNEKHVLKLALNPEHNDRLRGEAEVLEKLRDRHIVEVREVVEIGERVGLLMAPAGDGTLAQRLRKEGRLELELLERFGEQLLLTIDALEQAGIAHRDIKPENIGIRQGNRGGALELVLFDFSLSRTPVEEVRAGTPPYLEPFLAHRRPARWDTYAERFGAAMTLHEMATGTLPSWGDGRSHPAMTDGEVLLDPELFDGAIREPLTAFFGKALRRAYRERFDNAEEMRRAWLDCFTAAGERPTAGVTEVDDAEDTSADFQLEGVTLETELTTIGLSNRALNALERRNAQTVGDLLDLTMARITSTPGIGTKTRNELARLLRELRETLPTDSERAVVTPRPAGDEEQDETAYSVDRLAVLILPLRTNRREEPSRRQLALLLGLDRIDDAEHPGESVAWPSQGDVAKSAGVTRARVSQVIGKARERWTKHAAINRLRDDMVTLLEELGGVASGDELCAALLTLRGSTEDEPRRSVLARAVTRAALETERIRATTRWITRRHGQQLLVALDDSQRGIDGQQLADYAERLGKAADELAGSIPLAAPSRAIEVLRGVPGADGATVMRDDRIFQLATATAQRAALSSRQEIYPRGMEAVRALKLAQGALLGARELTPEQIRQRIGGRYPLAAELPRRPELDRLLGDLACDLAWDASARAGAGAYRLQSVDVGQVSTMGTSLGRYSTGNAEAMGGADPEVEAARDFEARLSRLLDQGGFLAIRAAPSRIERVAEELAGRFPVAPVDLDQVLIGQMKKEIEDIGAQWPVALEADRAGPEGQHWGRLLAIVNKALPKVEQNIQSHSSPVLLRRAGLLARYGGVEMLERLRDSAGQAGALPALVLLVPADGSSDMPKIDGVAVPVISRSQWANIPQAWIENRHRTSGSKPHGEGHP
jgi:serine/threonine protein kinase